MTQVKEDKRLKKNYDVVILDRSGSMESIKDVTRKGFNEQIQSLQDLAKKYVDQEFYATLITFSDTADIVFLNEKVDKLYELEEKDYQPRGFTALFDAIKVAIDEILKEAGDELKEDNDTVDAAVSITVLTDGEENRSSKENCEKVPGLIKELRGTGKWTFVYIGANQDVEAMAKRMNVDVSNTMAFNSTTIGTKGVMDTSKIARNAYYSKRASGKALDLGYFVDEDGKKMEVKEDSEEIK